MDYSQKKRFNLGKNDLISEKMIYSQKKWIISRKNDFLN